MGQTSRSRWAAIGAAIAVTLGAGGLVGVNAAGRASTLVPIDPVRILDTRSGDRVGSLDVAGASDPYRLKVAGVSGIPSTGVTGVSLNVTAVDTQSNDYGGFVTVYPCATASSARPDVSNLNFRSGQTLANSVTVPVSANGYICFYVYGTAHLLADANGYYTENTTGGTIDAYTKTETYSDDEVDALIAGIDAYTTGESDARYLSVSDSKSLDTTLVTRQEASYYSAPSIDLNSAGLPVVAVTKRTGPSVSPIDPSAIEMSLIFCEVASCAGENNRTVGIATPGAAIPEIQLTSDDIPVVTFATVAGNFLTMCSTSDCTGGTSAPITLSDQAVASHLALDAANLAGAAWVDSANDLHFVKCSNAACTSRQENTVVSGAENTSSDSMAMVIPTSGNPIFAYAGGAGFVETRLIFCNDPLCAGGDETVVTLDTDALPVKGLDLALTAAGLPVVAYVDADDEISLVLCQNADCSTKESRTGILPGLKPDVNVDESDVAHVAFIEVYTTVFEVDAGPPVSSRTTTHERLSAIRCTTPSCDFMSVDQTWPSVIELDGSVNAVVAPDGTLFATSLGRSLNARLTILP